LVEILDCELTGLDEVRENKGGIFIAMEDGARFQLRIERLDSDEDGKDDDDDDDDDGGDLDDDEEG